MKKNLLSIKIAVVTLGMLFSKTAMADFTAVTSGNWSSAATWGGTAPSSLVSGQNITIPSGITVTLDADVTFTGLLKTFMVNGVLTSTTTNGIFMTQGDFSGNGTVTVGKMMFSLLGTVSYAGTLNIKNLSNSATTLAFTSIANITDTLDLQGGTLSLNTNANLTMASGSTVKVGNGLLAVASGVFNSGNAYNVMYVGSSKTAGIELNSATAQHIYLNLSSNSQTIKLTSNAMVNGNLNMNSGNIDINGKKLTLKGDLMSVTGTSIICNNMSDIEIDGSGMLNSALTFSTGSMIHDLTINRTTTGHVKLASAISAVGHVNLMDGNLSIETTGILTMGANSTVHVEKGNLSLNSGAFIGTASYDVEFAGVSDGTSGPELSGSGLNNIMVNYIANTNKVVLNSNASITGKLNMIKGKLDLNGKILALNGLISQNANAMFIGSSTSELDLNLTATSMDTLLFDNSNAGNNTLGKLKINLADASTIMLNTKLMIANELSFVKGKMELINGDLEVMPAASITGYDDTKYVITSDANSGVLIQNVISGSTYVTFPVGLSTNYSPAYVQQTSTGTTGNFSAKCHSLTTNQTWGVLKAVNRTWMIEGAGVTTVNANVRFGWKAAAEVNAFDRTNAYVSHFTNSAWDMSAAASATAGVNSTFELSRLGLTSLSPFAVVENGAPLKVAELSKIIGVQMYPNPSKDVLNIKVLNSTDEYQYELIDITGRTLSSTSNTNSVNKFDVSGLGSGCYFVKITNLSDNTTNTQRFIKQ